MSRRSPAPSCQSARCHSCSPRGWQLRVQRHTQEECHRLETQLHGLAPPLSSGAGSVHAHLLRETALITGPC